MKVHNSIFINHSCPINAKCESPLHLSHCTFISCQGENTPGGIRWVSKGEDVFVDNVVAESCSSENDDDFAYLEADAVSESIISICGCRKGLHVTSIGDNSLVLNINISNCEASWESLMFKENQAEVRLARIHSCIASTYVVLGYISKLNRGSFIDVTNSTSASTTTRGVLRAESEIFLYRSNFVDNVGYVMFASDNAVKFNALNCYLRGLTNSSGSIETSSDNSWNSGLNKIPIVTAEGGRRREEMDSCRRLLKVPMSILRFLFIAISISI